MLRASRSISGAAASSRFSSAAVAGPPAPTASTQTAPASSGRRRSELTDPLHQQTGTGSTAHTPRRSPAHEQHEGSLTDNPTLQGR